MKVECGSEFHEDLLTSAAQIMASQPFATVRLEEIAHRAGVPEHCATDAFADLHSVGVAILDYEGRSMRLAQQQVAREEFPLRRIVMVFRAVGENLRKDIRVRAGVRIAGESHHLFPERDINPLRTWAGFVTSALEEAAAINTLRREVSIPDFARLLTLAGLGTKDALFFNQEWATAPDLFEQTAIQMMSLAQCTPLQFHGRDEY